MASLRRFIRQLTETVFKEIHRVWDPMQALTKTSPYADFRADSNTCTMRIAQPYASFNPIPESKLCPSQGLRIWPLFTFKILPQHHLHLQTRY